MQNVYLFGRGTLCGELLASHNDVDDRGGGEMFSLEGLKVLASAILLVRLGDQEGGKW